MIMDSSPFNHQSDLEFPLQKPFEQMSQEEQIRALKQMSFQQKIRSLKKIKAEDQINLSYELDPEMSYREMDDLAEFCLQRAIQKIRERKEKKNNIAPTPRNLFERALIAYEEGEFDQYHQLLEYACENGYLFAQFEMAEAYDYGKGGYPQDYQKAFHYYELVTKHKLKISHRKKLTTFIYDQDPPEKYRKKQSTDILQPIFQAYLMLGYFYENGFGVEKSYKYAFSKYMEAYDKGEKTIAPAYVARCFELGHGTLKSERQANWIYKKYAENLTINPFEDEQRAAEYYQKGDEEKRLRFLQRAFLCHKVRAELDNAESMLRISYFYRKGWGVEQSDELAERYLSLADGINHKELQFIEDFKDKADAGDPVLQTSIAKKYIAGEEIEKSLEQAKHYLLLASQQGYEEASFLLGFYYDAELFVDEHHYETAAKYYQKAIGSYKAKIRLGYLYQNGLGLEKSETSAFKLYSKAFYDDQIHDDIDYYSYVCGLLGECYERGLGVSASKKQSHHFYKLLYKKLGSREKILRKIAVLKDLADPQKLSSKELYYQENCYRPAELAFYYMKSLAINNDPVAQFELAEYYLQGFGTTQSDVEAVRYYNKSKNNGYEKAIEKIGSIFKTGKSLLPINPKSRLGAFKLGKEIKIFQDYADNKNDAISQFVMGISYKYGEGRRQSNEKAFEYFQKSASQNHMDAIAELGICYENGIGTSPSKELATQCYIRAKDLGSIRTLYELGKCYLDGSLEYLPEVAAYYYRIAAQYRDEEAQYALGWLYAEGVGVIQSFSHAYLYFEAAAKSGHAGALNEIARYFHDGIIVTKSIEKAAILYFGAYRKNFPNAKVSCLRCMKELGDSPERKADLERSLNQLRLYHHLIPFPTRYKKVA